MQTDYEDLEQLARLLDTKFRVPILGWRFGLDSLMGLVPGVGDAATHVVVPLLELASDGAVDLLGRVGVRGRVEVSVFLHVFHVNFQVAFFAAGQRLFSSDATLVGTLRCMPTFMESV